MADNKDRMKFQSTASEVTINVAAAVDQVLQNSAPAKSRFEQQAELMNYPLQDKPEVAGSVKSESVDDLRTEVAKLLERIRTEGKLPPALQKAIDAKKKGKDSDDDEDDEDDVKEDASNDKSDDGEGLDKADPKAAKKKFKDRKDKDIDNDGDTDDSDKFLHKKRKAIGKAMDKKEKREEAPIRVDGRNKTFKEKLRALGYVKERSLIYNNTKSGK
jgi:hypothetical protein